MASRAALGLLLLSGLLASPEAASGPMVQPRYSQDGQLRRPEGYRDWMFVAANLGMSYNDGPAGTPSFHNIYMQPQAYRYYKQNGRFPDKTMLVMERYSAGSIASINRQGQFQDHFLGLEVALKDEGHFAEKWAYFDFSGSGGAPPAQAKAFPKQACWDCHNAHGASDNVFTQFYPILRN